MRDVRVEEHGAGDETPAGKPVRRSSLERVHRLLSAFDYEHTRLTLTDLSRRAGLPLSTTHRMVGELLELGMLDRDDDDQLSIGVEVWKFGLLTPRTHGIQRVALPYMQDLYATTGLAVRLAIPHGDQATIVENLRSPSEAPHEPPMVGQRNPLYLSAVGMAILAFRRAEVQEEYLAKLRDAKDPALADAIRRELAQTRANGYSISSRLSAPRVAIGAPLLDHSGRPVASMSIVVPERTAATPYGHLVRSTARAVQRHARAQGAA